MLGFAPLTAATLADEGAVVYDLTASSIATGAPALASPAINQEHALTATAIATANPVVNNCNMAER